MKSFCMFCTDDIKRGERLAGEVAGWFDEAEGWRDGWQGGLKRRPAGDMAAEAWTSWSIDLSSLGGDSQRVTQLSLGVQGGSGMVLIDDILLYRNTP